MVSENLNSTPRTATTSDIAYFFVMANLKVIIARKDETVNFTLADLQELNDQMATALIPAMVVVGVLTVGGIVSNLLVVYIFSTRLKPSPQHFFIMCLAVFDLVSCSVAMPAEIADMVFFYTFESEVACKIFRLINSFTAFSSVFTLIAIAVDRYRKICQPHSAQMTVYHAKRLLLLVLALTILCSWPAPVIYGIASIDVGYSPIMGQDCTMNDSVNGTAIPLVYNFLILLGVLTLIVTIVVLYSLILHRLRQHARSMKIFQLEMVSLPKPKKPLCRLTQLHVPVTNIILEESKDGRESHSDKDGIQQKAGSDKQSLEMSYINGNSVNFLPTFHHKNSAIRNNISDGCPNTDTTAENSVCNENPPLKAVLIKQPSNSSYISESSDYTLDSGPFSSASKFEHMFTSAHRQSSVDGNSNYGSKQSVQTKVSDTISQKFSATSGRRNITSKTTKIAFVVTVVFILSYLPHIILQVVKFTSDFTEGKGAKLVVMNLLIRSYFMNSVANPIIYGLFNVQFREEVRLLVRRVCCSRSTETS